MLKLFSVGVAFQKYLQNLLKPLEISNYREFFNTTEYK